MTDLINQDELNIETIDTDTVLEDGIKINIDIEKFKELNNENQIRDKKLDKNSKKLSE